MTRVPPDDRRCTAMSKQAGRRCLAYASPGARVCRHHGGRSPQAKRAAARRLAEAKAERSLSDKGVRPLGDPLEAFRDLAAEAVALKDFFAATVAELRDGLTNVDKQGREEVRAKVAAYERAMDRAGRLLGEYVRLGIEDRLAKLDERRAALVEAAMVRLVVALGFSATATEVRRAIEQSLSPAVEAPRVIEVEAG